VLTGSGTQLLPLLGVAPIYDSLRARAAGPGA
jgi:hypothetical protein